jgi:hypothetical protein
MPSIRHAVLEPKKGVADLGASPAAAPSELASAQAEIVVHGRGNAHFRADQYRGGANTELP